MKLVFFPLSPSIIHLPSPAVGASHPVRTSTLVPVINRQDAC